MEPNDVQREAAAKWHADNDPDDTGYEFCDNFRYANKDNPAEVVAYEEARAEGCCGNVDVELACSDGTTFLYGFNYGH